MMKWILPAAALATLTPAQAQIPLPWGVDIRSSLNPVSGSPLADRLYYDSTQGAVSGNRLPATTSFWLVIDGLSNGVNFDPSTVPVGTTFNIDTLLQPDDALYRTTLHAPGRISRNFTGIPPALRGSSNPNDPGYTWTRPMWGLLFNEPNVDHDRPGDPGFDPLFDGAKFGVWYFGPKSIPELGNAIAVIHEPLYADRFNFVPVPEPSTTALFAGALLGLGALSRRVWRNRP